MGAGLGGCERAEFGVADIVRETNAILFRNLGMLFSWGLMLMAVYMGGYLYVEFHPFEENEKWMVRALDVGVAMIGAPFWSAFAVKINRFVLLEERQGGVFWKELFRGRTWLYLVNDLILGMKAAALSMLFGIIPLAVFVALSGAAGGMWRAIAMVLCFVALLVCSILLPYLVLAPQLVLVLPEVSIDGRGTFSRLGQFGAYKRWTMMFVWVLLSLAWLCGLAVQYAFHAMGYEDAVLRVILVVAGVLVEAGVLTAKEVARAVMYRRTSPYWPKEEVAEAMVGAPAADDGAYRP